MKYFGIIYHPIYSISINTMYIKDQAIVYKYLLQFFAKIYKIIGSEWKKQWRKKEK